MKKNLTLSLGILAIANEVYGMNNPQDLLLALQTMAGNGKITINLANRTETDDLNDKIMRNLNIVSQYNEPDKKAQLVEKMNNLMQEIANGNTANINEIIVPDLQATPLHYAMGVNNNYWISQLILNGADLEIPDCMGDTLLHHIAENNDVEIAQLLEEKNPDFIIRTINKQNMAKKTPLHIAAFHEDERMCEWLLEKGAHIDARDMRNRTPLFCSTISNLPKMMTWLLDHHAEIDSQDIDGMTPLMRAISYNSSFVKDQLKADHECDYLELIKLLLDRKANVKIVDKRRCTPLHMAARFGTPKMCELLIERGADINAINMEGQFPFTIAKERGEKLIGELLIFSGADVRNEVASTQRKQKRLGNKPVVWRKDVDSFLPGFVEAINPSIRKDKNEERIFEEFVNDVIENQISVDIKDKNGNTLLLIALQKGWGEIAELLISSGADINAQNNDGETPISAALKNNLEMVAGLLIDRGVDLTAKDKFGATPLHHAVFSRSYKMVELLISTGMDPNAKDNMGCTPLQIASFRDYSEIGKLLIEKGARIDLADNEGLTPWQVAIQSNSILMADLLIKNGASASVQDLTNAIQDNAQELEKLLIIKGVPYPEDIQAASQDHVFKKLSKKKLQDFYKRLKQYRSELQTSSSDSDDDANSVNNSPEHSVSLINSPNSINNPENLEKRKRKLMRDLKRSHPYFAQLLLEKGKTASYRGVPLLLLAVRYNIPELAELMILNGADTTIRNDWNETLLHIAAQNNSVPMIRLLLNAGVRIDILGNAEYNCTPLYQAIFFGSIDAAKFLIEHGANVNRPDSHGTPPIVKAAEMGSLKPELLKEYEEIILSLQKHRADINAKDGNGKTALHRTAYQDNSSMLEFLLRHGANASAIDNRGETPLFAVAYRNNEASASALLKYGAQVNVGNIYKWTPLHKSYKWGADKVKKLLLTNKANPDALDELGRKPYQAMIPEQIYLSLDSFPTLE